MKATLIERKALGYDILIKLISLGVVVLSYFYVVTVLNGKMDDTNFLHLQFIKNAFVFIAPAALEGMNILISAAQENKKQDMIEVILSLGCVIIGVFLFIISLLNITYFYGVFIFAILAYPIRIVSSLVFDILKLLERR